MRSHCRVFACCIIAGLHLAASAMAAYAPAQGHHATKLYDTSGLFTIIEGLSVDGDRAYFTLSEGRGADVNYVGPAEP